MLYNASLYCRIGKYKNAMGARLVSGKAFGLPVCTSCVWPLAWGCAQGPRQAAPNGPRTKTDHEASEQHGRVRAAHSRTAAERHALCTFCVHSGRLRSARLRTDAQCGRLLSSERSARRARTLTNCLQICRVPHLHK